MQHMLERASIACPRWAMAVSDLVPVEQKRHFAELMPRGCMQRIQQARPPAA
ncbi:MAG: hypothetical protein H6740_01340 [Alphaproteobacteria bacterium]|nr:hypothetical protein [Alphaproteobacteria bacterium]